MRWLIVAVCVGLTGCLGPKQVDDTLVRQIEGEVLALRTQNKVLKEKAEACFDKTRVDPVFNELHAVMKGDDNVVVTHDGVITVLTMRDAHLVGSDGFSIREEARKTLDILATALNEHPGHTVVIEGHTADIGGGTSFARKFPNLYDQGYQRATAVMNLLVRQFKVPEESFTLMSRGPHKPVDTNDTPEGQAHNRRLVVSIYPPGMRP
jgi:chemotaxis protein MotB